MIIENDIISELQERDREIEETQEKLVEEDSITKEKNSVIEIALKLLISQGMS